MVFPNVSPVPAPGPRPVRGPALDAVELAEAGQVLVHLLRLQLGGVLRLHVVMNLVEM